MYYVKITILLHLYQYFKYVLFIKLFKSLASSKTKGSNFVCIE